MEVTVSSVLANELAALLRRDLTKLCQQVKAFTDEAQLWQVLPGVENSAGNLAMHLEGNLREYIGRQLGGLEYVRNRPVEFAGKDVPRAALISRLENLAETIPGVVEALSDDALAQTFPEKVLGPELSSRQFIIHLHGHLNYHLGQIDYLRRILASGKAIDYVRLP